VITGAAAIMMAVFIAFAGAMMLLFGDWVGWLPRPLKNLLPEIDLHGEARVGRPG
jgi:hypothetical protein